MSALRDLRNIGAVVAAELEDAGIADAEALWIAKDGGITRTDGFNIAE